MYACLGFVVSSVCLSRVFDGWYLHKSLGWEIKSDIPMDTIIEKMPFLNAFSISFSLFFVEFEDYQFYGVRAIIF